MKEGRRERECGGRKIEEEEKGHSVCGPPFVSILPCSSSSSPSPLGDKKPSGHSQKRRHGAAPSGSSPRQKYLGVLSSSLSVPLSLACGGLLPECPAVVTNIFTCAVTLEIISQLTSCSQTEALKTTPYSLHLHPAA